MLGLLPVSSTPHVLLTLYEAVNHFLLAFDSKSTNVKWHAAISMLTINCWFAVVNIIIHYIDCSSGSGDRARTKENNEERAGRPDHLCTALHASSITLYRRESKHACRRCSVAHGMERIGGELPRLPSSEWNRIRDHRAHASSTRLLCLYVHSGPSPPIFSII
jgi:hypothetical protein